MSRRLVAIVCSVVVALGVAGVALAVTGVEAPPRSSSSNDDSAAAAGRQLAEQVDDAARTHLAPRSLDGTDVVTHIGGDVGADAAGSQPGPVGDVAGNAGDASSSRVRVRTFTPSLIADVPQLDPSGCDVSSLVRIGSTGPEVACIERLLVGLGMLDAADGSFDDSFDEGMAEAVRAFQAQTGLTVDGIVGPATAQRLGIWVDPADTAADPATCEPVGRSVVIDRDRQLAWFCENGTVGHELPITTALSQPDPGDYEVYAKDLHASSTFGGGHSTMTHFVAFTYGKFQGARVAFHSVPKWGDGSWVQPLESVGDADRHGDSSGCIRVLPDDAEAIWDWLELGGHVRVVT